MTSSPTVFISSSIFSTLTRIEPPSPMPLLRRFVAPQSAAAARGRVAPVACAPPWNGGRRRRSGGAAAAFSSRDLQLAIAFGPIEHLVDHFARGVGVDGQVPGEIAGLGIELAKAGRFVAATTTLSRRAPPARAACAADRCRARTAAGTGGNGFASDARPRGRRRCVDVVGAGAAIATAGAELFCAIASSRSNCSPPRAARRSASCPARRAACRA